MEGKISKIITVILLLITLTMVNFIYVGVGFVSLAAEKSATNHANIEFTAELKSESLLTLGITVKNEGYFNGEITLENSNFNLKESDSEYVNNIEDNIITLNQINAGTTVEINVEIELIKDDSLDVSLLTTVSDLKLTGIYRDSTEKDINIEATREVELDYTESNSEDNIENDIEIITNKILQVDGEEKRVIQISINMGLKDNNYPIKEINTSVTLPEEESSPEVVTKTNFNTMTYFEYNYDNNVIEMSFTNEPDEENKILWEKSGCENVILTLVYNNDVNLEEGRLTIEQTVKLYNDKEITVSNTLEIGNEEKDALVQVSNTSSESTIYKGKLKASLDRSFETTTDLIVNLSDAEDSITLIEDSSYYVLSSGQTSFANVVYNRTTISKDNFDEILGENGYITILNQNGEQLAEINSTTPVDEDGNIVIDYTGKEPSSLTIETSAPITEGNLTFTHTKTIKAGEANIVENATQLVSNATIDYGTGVTNSSEVRINLEESSTEVKLEINKESLSTVVENSLEIRAILRSNDEQYNLFENPTIVFQLPEAVENITINNIELLYETELSVGNYVVDGRTITVSLIGTQTNYKDSGIEGSLLVIDTSVEVDRKAATQDSKIIMAYANKEETGLVESDIKIVAPTDMTVIHSIDELGIETIGEEESVTATLERGTEEINLQTEIEVINNSENTVENVKILGTFPTKSEENNIDISVTEGISIEGIEGATVYYTENEDATDDIEDSENGWQETITDGSTVRKYLIEISTMESGTSVNANYTINVPASLEYNQEASQDYTVSYENSLTGASNQIEATTINLETGVGPDLETSLTSSISGTEQEDGATVKNGEVIKYKIEVSNVGSEEITNVLVTGNVPDGTTLVEPKDNYEYTGASYYDELEDRTYQTTIDTLGVGEVITLEYEVRVNTDTSSGTELINKSSITYGDVTKESEETRLVTSTGDIRVTVKRVTDEDVDLYETGTVQYFAIIENISDETQEDVIVKTNISDSLQVNRLRLITNMESQDVSDEELSDYDVDSEPVEITEEDLTDESGEAPEYEEIEYQDEINIGSIAPGENKVLSYDLEIQNVDETSLINFSVVAMVDDDEYRSNIVSDYVKQANISLSMTANPEEDYLNSGDTLQYTITIKNDGTDIEGLVIKDEIPSSLTVDKVTFDGEEITELSGVNNIEIRCNISGGTESTIVIETIVNYSEGRTEAEAITNVAYAELLAERIATTQEITHIIEANESQSSGTTSSDNNVDDNDIANGSCIITGIAWFDENSNGQKDDDEELVSGVKVHLYNTQTNNLVRDEEGNILEATTNSNGVYVLNNIGNGSYIVIFEYDDSVYTLTTYKAEGVSESNNSDAIMKELTIEGETQEVASTDIIEINEENISDINIGFVELQNFDLQLEKFVTKIIIQDSSGSTVKEYDDETLARAELDAKRVEGATVLIEYKIRVSNVGDVDGYVRRIVDYMPSDLQFSSELNKDWYQTSDGLYNVSLANDVIAPGESREVTLTLTKSMTASNVGLINNTAEIDEAYNELGLADINSTPGNRASGENDMGSADVLLGIRTGGTVYIGGAIVAVAVLGTIAFVVIKKRKKDKEEI